MWNVVGRLGQMKIMQMSFMIIGVFLFFALAGLFFLNVSLRGISGGAEELAREQAISSLESIAAMPELSYDARTTVALDEDKLRIMAGGFGDSYGDFWPIASLEVYKVYPAFDSVVECPAAECNYYDIYDSGQENIEKFSAYVSICKRVKEFGSVYDRCEIGKIVAGVKKYEE